jgi:hypothetical protein
MGHNFPRRRLAIAFLILPELTALSLPLPAAYLGDGWWLLLFSSRRMIAAIFLATTFAALLLSWGHPRDLIATLFGIAAILNLTRQDVLFQPDQGVVGTSRFAVTIDPGCSGLEGVGLIVVMTSLYLSTISRAIAALEVDNR